MGKTGRSGERWLRTITGLEKVIKEVMHKDARQPAKWERLEVFAWNQVCDPESKEMKTRWWFW